jgi:hypothetical protein
MWTTLALMSALQLVPAQAEQLQLKNPRFTYGILGQERKDSNFLPGDLVVLSFDIDGLKVKDDGSARYSMGMQLFSQKKGKNVFEQDPQKLEVVNSLGGSRQPVFALTNILPDMEPGDYTMKLTVNDETAKSSQKLERKFTVKPVEFSLVRVGFVYLNMSETQAGAAPLLAPPMAVPGQSLMLHFTAVGFSEAGNDSKPKLSVKMEIQDESGKPVLAKPFGLKQPITNYPDDETKKYKILPFQMPIQVNRSGKFKIVLSATDEHSHKTVSMPPLDLTVVEVNK